MQELKETDKAYMAGIIDGEGTFNAHTVNGGKQWCIQVHVTSVDMVLLEHCKVLYGGSTGKARRPGTNLGNLPIFRWDLCGEAAGKLAVDLLPYLKIKHKQAEALVESRNTITPNDGSRTDPIDMRLRDICARVIRQNNQRMLQHA